MRAKKITICSAVILTALSVSSFAIENKNIINPASSGRIPHISSRQSGLRPSPNPMNRNSNLVITGNVGGGRHFRGTVPYNATTDFGGTLGSTSLDNFRRRSLISGISDRSPGMYRPYYSPTKTVTTQAAGNRLVTKPISMQIHGQAYDRYRLSARPSPRIAKASQQAATNIYNRPLSLNLRIAEQSLMMDGTDITGRKPAYVDARNKSRSKQVEKTRENTSNLSEKIISPQQYLDGKIEVMKAQLKEEQKEVRPKPFELPKHQTKQIAEESPDIYEQMKAEFEATKLLSGQLPKKEKVEKSVAAKLDKDKAESEEVEAESEKEPEIDIRLKAIGIRGKHKTFASYNNDRFNDFMREAEAHIKTGKFYRAADSYTLASIYKPKNPLAYAGKSHALFASGEYMGSAYFLSRTLEIFPEYADVKVDIIAMIGDRDKVESRIEDIEQWYLKNHMGELQFLLAYIYYQTDRLDRANVAIDIAYEKMPETTVVSVLKAAISRSSE